MRHRRLPDHYYEARTARGLRPFEGPLPDRGCHGWVQIGMMVLSAMASANAADQKGQADSAAASYQAAVARNNEIIAKQNAQYATQKGEALAEEKRQRTAQMIGAQRARAGASGFTVESETPLRLQSDTAQLGKIDELTIRNNAAREAYGWESQGANFAGEAGLLDMKSKNAAEAGEMGYWSSIIGGASSVANKWQSFKTAGVGGFSS